MDPSLGLSFLTARSVLALLSFERGGASDVEMSKVDEGKSTGMETSGRGMRMRICFFVGMGVLAFSGGFSQTAGENNYVSRAQISHAGETVHLSANDPRPLAQALDALQREYGWLVNYEDPRYVSKLDLVEVTNPPQHRSADSGSQVHYPGGGAFNLDFPNGIPPNSPPDEQATLQLLVDAYNRSNNPGRFDLRKTAEQRFDVVGTSAHDAMGHISRQEVFFDLPVTLVDRQRSAFQTIELICAQITERTHTKVTLGVFPMSLQTTMVKVGGAKVPARTLLSRALATTGRKFVWRLLFDPDSKKYFLRCLLA